MFINIVHLATLSHKNIFNISCLVINIRKQYFRYKESAFELNMCKVAKRLERKKERRRVYCYGFSTASVRVLPHIIGMLFNAGGGPTSAVLAPTDTAGTISGVA